ncbi:MAG: 16S rRNA (cytidine(1402)-2'-O)-methyltransferase [Ruminococcaceae bacterium]|nr:16S rRNA (cytidine(1402)-2'-O)-methyltransferase [Oscillospiraceae bacterium]
MMEKGILYLCATPIGNLSDMSKRTIEVLSEVDIIACEDTRNTRKLLTHFNISKPLTSYHEHNKAEKGEELTNMILEGKNIALVSDAGTPAISDPGEDLVRLCAMKDITVTSIPGPAAFVNALILSGLPTGRFSFEGFLSVNKKNRNIHLNEVKNDTRTLIFHEAPHKLLRTLKDMLEVFGDRRIALCRELTKMFEEIKRTTLSEAVEFYENNPPKGEFVLVIEGEKREKLIEDMAKEYDDISIEDHVDKLISEGMVKKEAIKQVATLRNMKKSDVYNLYEKKND